MPKSLEITPARFAPDQKLTGTLVEVLHCEGTPYDLAAIRIDDPQAGNRPRQHAFTFALDQKNVTAKGYRVLIETGPLIDAFDQVATYQRKTGPLLPGIIPSSREAKTKITVLKSITPTEETIDPGLILGA